MTVVVDTGRPAIVSYANVFVSPSGDTDVWSCHPRDEAAKPAFRFGYQRIAAQLALVFDVGIDEDVVRRVLAKHYRPDRGDDGPSWLSLLGNAKDNLWSLDLFRCESLSLKTHWVMVVMDQCTRRIVGFAIHAGVPDGPAVCRMLATGIAGAQELPRHLSTDHDPLFDFQRWKANLRILEIEPVKAVPCVPLSHPFIERLIGTVRPRPLGSRSVLERARSRTKTRGVQGLLQRGAHASGSMDNRRPRDRSGDIDSVRCAGSSIVAAFISFRFRRE